MTCFVKLLALLTVADLLDLNWDWNWDLWLGYLAESFSNGADNVPVVDPFNFLFEYSHLISIIYSESLCWEFKDYCQSLLMINKYMQNNSQMDKNFKLWVFVFVFAF